jgi:hypothetical protein
MEQALPGRSEPNPEDLASNPVADFQSASEHLKGLSAVHDVSQGVDHWFGSNSRLATPANAGTRLDLVGALIDAGATNSAKAQELLHKAVIFGNLKDRRQPSELELLGYFERRKETMNYLKRKMPSWIT